MKSTRRGALVLMLGSASALVVDTTGFSSANAERSVEIEVVDDDRAFLQLTHGDDPNKPLNRNPEVGDDGITVGNALHTDLEITLESDDGTFCFRLEDEDGECADDCSGSCPDGYESTVGFDLESGTERTIDVVPNWDETDVDSLEEDEKKTAKGTISIHADGESVEIDAERELEVAGKKVGEEAECSGLLCLDLSLELSWS